MRILYRIGNVNINLVLLCEYDCNFAFTIQRQVHSFERSEFFIPYLKSFRHTGHFFRVDLIEVNDKCAAIKATSQPEEIPVLKVM